MNNIIFIYIVTIMTILRSNISMLERIFFVFYTPFKW